jgi:predicted DCC family thiol-disulfide oxidoreductase YuxK
MDAEGKKSTIFFDGSCPLCRAEISHYRDIDEACGLSFVDISAPHAATPDGITRQQAMARFHVRVEVWRRLPGWRWLARLAALPGGVAVLELAYRSFLPVRPVLSRLFARLTRRKPLA